MDDLLAWLEREHQEEQPEEQRLALNECPQHCVALVPVGDGHDDAARSCSQPRRLPTMKGKVGAGRHGSEAEKQLLSLHMRHCKSLKKAHEFQVGVSDLLQDSSFYKGGQLVEIRAKATSAGIILRFEKRSKKGNRFQRSIPWSTFFRAAYGRLKRSSHISMALEVAHSSVNFMINMVGSVYMGQQMLLLGRLIHLAASNPPFAMITQLKFDETSLLCSLNADKSDARVRSTWQTMVSRRKLLLVFPCGRSMIFSLVQPPIPLLSTGAEHIYYGLRNHPCIAGINDLLRILGRHCQHRVSITECDGASSNSRLMAHLYQKNKAEEEQHRSLLVHVRCQNHATQLINVSLVAAVGENILNRLYGFTIFVRNLGFWMRLRQALREWVSENLIFKPEAMGGTLRDSVTPDPVCVELIEYLRSNLCF